MWGIELLSQKVSMYPGVHPLRHDPSVLSHSPSRQLGLHLSLQAAPYLPVSHSEEIVTIYMLIG